MRKLLLVLAFLLAPGLALAQGCGPQNPNCIVPTAPFGTNNNQAASTAFVQQAINNLPVTCTYSGPFATLTQCINTSQTVSGSMTTAANLNTMVFQESVACGACASNVFLDGFSIIHGINGGSGGRQTFQITTVISAGASPWSASINPFIAVLVPSLTINANVGGTSPTPNGLMFTFNPGLTVSSAATFLAEASNDEHDYTNSSASTKFASILKLFTLSSHSQHATSLEAALVFGAASGSAGLRNMMVVGNFAGGASPFDGTLSSATTNGGSVLTLAGAPGFKFGVDFLLANPQTTDLTAGFPFRSGVQISTVATATYLVDWYGNITASSLTGSGIFNSGGLPTITNYLTLFAPGQVGSDIILGNNSDATIYIRSGIVKWQNFAASSTWMELFASGGLYVGQSASDPGANNLTVQGIIRASSAGSAPAPSLVVGNATTGFYSVSTTGLGMSVNGSVVFDYNITNPAAFTMSVPLVLPNSGLYLGGNQALSRNGGTGTVTLTSNAASIILSPASTTIETLTATSVTFASAATVAISNTTAATTGGAGALTVTGGGYFAIDVVIGSTGVNGTITATGAGSGTNGGVELALISGTTNVFLLGNHSAVLGGAYNSNGVMYSFVPLEIWASNALEMDFAVTTASTWTLAAATTINNATFKVTTLANSATTSAVCYAPGTGLFTYDGTIGTCNTSDETLKVFEGPIEHALERLAALGHTEHFGYFHANDDGLEQFGSGRKIGAGAQTVAQFFPELVERGSNGLYSLAYDKLTIPIITGLALIIDACDAAANDNFCVELKRRISK